MIKYVVNKFIYKDVKDQPKGQYSLLRIDEFVTRKTKISIDTLVAQTFVVNNDIENNIRI